MVHVRSVDGEQVYDNRRRRNYWPQSEYTRSDAGSEYYYDQDGSRRNSGRAPPATRFNPYAYNRGGFEAYSSGRRQPEVRTYTLGEEPQPMGFDRLRAVSGRGYRQGYYEDDERFMLGKPGGGRRMQGDAYLSRSTYPRFLVPGWGHILIGLFLIIMGLVDIGYTASEYGDGCLYTGIDFDPGPCEAKHVYTYVASPVWGGIFMIMTGAITFWMNAYRLRYNDWLLKAFCGLAVFLVIAICPAIIVLNILEITQNEDTYWKTGNGITLEDDAKFAFPVVVVILGFLDWVVAIISVCVCICFPPRDLTYEKKPRYLPQPYLEPEFSRSAPRQPVIVREEVIQPRRGNELVPYNDMLSRPSYRDEMIPRAVLPAGPSYREEIIPRAQLAAGPSYNRERPGTVVYEERIPGGARRDDDVYSVYTDASQYSRGGGGRRGRRADYAYRGDDYDRSYYY